MAGTQQYASRDYKFYMRRYGTDDDAAQPVKDLEVDFPGLVCQEAAGLSSKGSPKNIYYEEYAENEETRVYIPDTVCLDSTEIELKFVFLGEDRRETYDSFFDYVSAGKIKYWDTARNRLVHIVLDAATEPDEDVLKGGTHYIIAAFTFRNLFGRSYRCDNSGNVIGND